MAPSFPTFLIIGAMKAGTTSLFEYLSAHPQVFMPHQKEVHYFTRPSWEIPAVREWYSQMFASSAAVKALARGEASPGYSRFPDEPGDVPRRIAEMLPDVQIIYLVRHPVARLVSHYRHNAEYGKETRSLAEAARDQVEYVAPSRYGLQLTHYLKHFDRSQILVISSEELVSTREAILCKVLEFIGVDPTILPKNLDQNFNRGGEHRPLRGPAARLYGSRMHQVTRALVPSYLKGVVSRAASKPAPALDTSQFTLDPETQAWLEAELRPDLVTLAGYLGPEFQAWGLLDP